MTPFLDGWIQKMPVWGGGREDLSLTLLCCITGACIKVQLGALHGNELGFCKQAVTCSERCEKIMNCIVLETTKQHFLPEVNT